MLPESPHALPAPELLARLRVSDSDGLSDNEVRRRRKHFGPNTITARRAASALRLLLHQFTSPVVYLLGAAAALAFYFGELEEGGAIVAVLALNALIGFVTELKAARSIEALRALGGRTARVRREGRVRLVPAEELVPGDIVLLDAGDAVSADLRLVEASRMAADESTLTGEFGRRRARRRSRSRAMRVSAIASRCCSRARPLRAAAASVWWWRRGLRPSSAG